MLVTEPALKTIKTMGFRDNAKCMYSLAQGDAVFEDVSEVQLVPQTLVRRREGQGALEHRFHPVERFACPLDAELGLCLLKE